MGRRHFDVLRSLIDAYRGCDEMVIQTRMEVYEVSSVATAMQPGDLSWDQLDQVVQRAEQHFLNLQGAREVQRGQRPHLRGERWERWRRDNALDQEMTQLHEMLEEFLSLQQWDHDACRDIALQDASWHDDLSVVRKFVDLGVKRKDAALVTAAGLGHVAVAMLLLKSGANAHAASDEDSAILEYVKFNGEDAEQEPGTFLEMMASLLGHGADLDDEMFRDMPLNIREETSDACVACFEQWRKQKRSNATLVKVPVEVFRRGADAVKTYFAEWETSQTLVARSKICIVGPSMWGKTSLAKTLTSGIPTMEHREDRTIGIDLFPWTFKSEGRVQDGKRVEYEEVTFWDFGGQDVYRGAYSIFYSQRTLFLLCVDLEEYARVLKHKLKSELAQFFNDNILRWFRLVFARQPEAQVVLAGTKADAESLNKNLIDFIKEDVIERLEKWAQKNRNAMDNTNSNAATGIRRHLSRSHSAFKNDDEASFQWLITSSKDTSVADRVRRELQQIVVSSGKGFVMPDKYFAVLEYVRGLRLQAENYSEEDRLAHIFRDDTALCFELMNNLETNAPTMKDCKAIFQILHDLGDLLYFENTGIGFLDESVVVDPHVIVDFVRQIIRHDRTVTDDMADLQSRGLVRHELLKTLPLWKDISDERMVVLKKLLQHFRMAYPAGPSQMTREADIIVPALWTVHEPVNQTSLQFEEALKEFHDASDKSCTFVWEYEFPGDVMPDDAFYEEVVVELYHPDVLAVVLSNRIDLFKNGSFAARLCLHQEFNRSNIQIETAAYETSMAWTAMRFLIRAVELALARFPGIPADHYIAVKRDGQEKRFNLETELSRFQKGQWIGNLTGCPEWLPANCDLKWFVDKAWNSKHYFEDIQNSVSTKKQLDRLDNKIDVLHRMAIIGEQNRELPALWTAERLPTEMGSRIQVRMLSDLSGRCFHKPIDIKVLPDVVGAYGEWIKIGLSVFSTVAPSKWIVSSSDLRAALGIDRDIDKTVQVYNLIDGTDLKTSGYIDTSADRRLDPQKSKDFLRKLLEIHCGGFDPGDVSSLSNLSCGIIKKSGVHVWAAQDELEKYREVITPRADFATLTRVRAQIVGSIQGSLVIRHVAGLTDWDWRKTYVEWKFVDAAGLTLASGRTSMNSDKSKEPNWSDKQHFPIDSFEELRKTTLTITSKRPSRCVFLPVKEIGTGSVAIAAVLPSSAPSTPISFSIRLPEKGTITCELAIEVRWEGKAKRNDVWLTYFDVLWNKR